jgi:hypothetical protein
LSDLQASQSNQVQFRFLAIGFLVVTTLIALNIATLVNKDAHAIGFAVVQAVSRAIGLGEGVLANSPTSTRAKEIESAQSAVLNELKQTKAVVLGLTVANAQLILSNTEFSKRLVANKVTAQAVAARIGQRSVTSGIRNAAKLPARSVPWAGIAVNLALITMDVREACDTVRDINDLNRQFALPQEDETRVCGIRMPTIDELKEAIRAM